MRNILVMLIIVFYVHNAFAVQRYHTLASNPHFKTLNYVPNDIHIYVGYYNCITEVDLEYGEIVNSIAMGKPSAWQIKPQGSHIYIKPLADDADTMAIMTTNKRRYFLQFHAEDAKDMDDKNVPYNCTFCLSILWFISDMSDDGSGIKQFGDDDVPNYKSDPQKYNFRYEISGPSYIAPIKAFDDGRFTYLQFPAINGTIPAIFAVDTYGDESLVNFRIRGDFVVIEQVNAVFTLRYGRDAVCLFNDKIPYHRLERVKHNRSLIGRFLF